MIKCTSCKGFKVIPMLCDVMLVQILIDLCKWFSYLVYNNYSSIFLVVQIMKYFSHFNQVVLSEYLTYLDD